LGSFGLAALRKAPKSCVGLHLVLGGHAHRVVHDERDVLAPQRQERLAGVLAVDGAHRAGDVDGVAVERGGRGLELGLTSVEGGTGGGRGEEDVLAEEGVQPGAELRGLRRGGGMRGREGGADAGREGEQGDGRDEALHGDLLSQLTCTVPRMAGCRAQK
jgi:hypothetical protein